MRDTHWLPVIEIDANNGPGNYYDVVTEEYARDLKVGDMVLAVVIDGRDDEYLLTDGFGFVGRISRMEPREGCMVVWAEPLTLLNLTDLGVFQTAQSPPEPPEPAPAGEDTPEVTLAAARAAEGRCTRCGNWPAICGHHLTFAERMRSIGVDRSSLR